MAATQSYPRFVYEDFKPMSEWKEEPGNNILFVHLPEFSKEQIRIRCIRSSRRIRVQGEREVEKQIRSRVDQTYEIPENCKIEKIHANWHDGVLCITLPKDTITQVVSDTIQPPKTHPEESLASKEEPKLPGEPEEKGRKEVSEFETPPSIPKPEPKQTETQLTHAAVSPSSSGESQKSEEKGRNEVSEFETLPPSILKPEQKQTETQTHDAAKSSSSIKSQKSEEKDRDEVSDLSPTKKAEEEKKKKEKTTSTSYEKDEESTLKKAVGDDDVVANKREGKQLILNMGVAALVILSVVVYVSYKFGSKLT